MILPAFDAQLVKVTSKVDRTCKLELNTQELGTDAGQLMNLTGQMLKVLFVGPDETITETEIPDAPASEEYGNRTPAQQQRAVLYRIWEARSQPMGSFEAYYRHRMSRNDQLLKDELDSLTT